MESRVVFGYYAIMRASARACWDFGGMDGIRMFGGFREGSSNGDFSFSDAGAEEGDWYEVVATFRYRAVVSAGCGAATLLIRGRGVLDFLVRFV